jgi:predicted RNA-binding Zn-ribbon protein involved in translation (DUF1610 family)
MLKKKCVNCGSQLLAQSRLKNVRERLLKALGNRPYRCLSCGWRGYLNPTDRRIAAKRILGFILIVIFFVSVIVSAYYVLEDSLQKYQSRINKKALAKPKPKPKLKPETKHDQQSSDEDDSLQDFLRREIK